MDKQIKILVDEATDSLIVYVNKFDCRIVLTPAEAEELFENLEDAIFDEDEHHHSLEAKYQRTRKMADEYEEEIHTLREIGRCK